MRYRFAVLIIEIKQAEVMPYVGAVLGLINCIILGACGFRFRTRIRNEFLGKTVSYNKKCVSIIALKNQRLKIT